MPTTPALPVRAVELLASRICHDLVSPVGAIGNGVELLTEMGADGLEDSLSLLSHSARAASVRLQLFRLCYGAGGSEALISGKMIYEAFNNFIAGEKVSLTWDLMNDVPEEDLPAGFFKVLLNAMILARESLPKGGIVKVTKGVGRTMLVEATGDTVIVRDGVAEALAHLVNAEDLTPKTVHAYVTRSFSNHAGTSMTMDVNEARLTIRID